MNDFIAIKTDIHDDIGIYHINEIRNIKCWDTSINISLKNRDGKTIYYKSRGETLDAFNEFLKIFGDKCHIINDLF